MIFAIYDLQLPTKFPVRWRNFQDSGHSGQLGFRIDTILAIFDQQVAPTLPTKLRFNWPMGVGVVG